MNTVIYMSSVVREKKRAKKHKKKIILAIVISSIIVLLLGIGFPVYKHIKDNYKFFEVTNVQFDPAPSEGNEIDIHIEASYYHSIPDSRIKVYLFSNRCTKKLRIWVYAFYPESGAFLVVEYTNQTVHFTFPKEGNWTIITNNYTTEITVN